MFWRCLTSKIESNFAAFLQAEILILVLGEIQGFCLGGNPFAWVIPKAAAAVLQRAHPRFAAQNLSILQLDAKSAVCTGTGDSFAK